VGYFFARDVLKDLKVPIGLIMSSEGATPIESWTPATAFEGDPNLKPVVERWARTMAGAPPERALKYPAPGILFNAMIHPLAPYAIRGVLWYQGEDNTNHGKEYRAVLSAMIRAWRAEWGQGDFAFGIVQLPNFGDVKPEPAESSWADLRESQAATALDVPNCGLAVTVDVGDPKDLHPKNKQAVGSRLALWALATQYGKKIEYSGPVVAGVKAEGNRLRVTFKHVGSGLEVKGGGPLKGFAVAGANGKFVWAEARIEKDSVVVGSSAVPEPRAVRYAWADAPECNLYNKEGLPAVPFRSDDR
jgi:sialate O-acetylesterase